LCAQMVCLVLLCWCSTSIGASHEL
jgi:hypothetical protein